MFGDDVRITFFRRGIQKVVVVMVSSYAYDIRTQQDLHALGRKSPHTHTVAEMVDMIALYGAKIFKYGMKRMQIGMSIGKNTYSNIIHQSPRTADRRQNRENRAKRIS